eukprot:115449-Pelagomonas_calceolata.AAC.1
MAASFGTFLPCPWTIPPPTWQASRACPSSSWRTCQVGVDTHTHTHTRVFMETHVLLSGCHSQPVHQKGTSKRELLYLLHELHRVSSAHGSLRPARNCVYSPNDGSSAGVPHDVSPRGMSRSQACTPAAS